MIVGNDNETVKLELTPAAVGRIQAFESKLEEDGAVSRQDVLSLEEFVGAGFITKTINPNKLSSRPTINCLADVKKVVKETLTSTDISAQPTHSELVSKILNVEYALKDIKVTLEKAIAVNTNDNSVISKLLDEKLRYRFIEDKATDLVDLPIVEVVKWHTSYLEGTINPEIYDDLMRLEFDPETTVLPLLSMLKGKQFENFFNNPKISMLDITFRDIIDIVENNTSYLSDVEALMSQIAFDVRSIKNESRWFASEQSRVNELTNKYTMLSDIICGDNQSISLVRAIYYNN